MSASNPVCAASPPPLGRRALPRASAGFGRGFTLIELMVVVVIVGILAVIAVPSMVERMRERRSQEAAQRVASIYRLARLRAMGRGAATLVRFQNGAFDVYEAVLGDQASNPNCFNLPSSSCTGTEWDNDKRRKTTTRFAVAERGEFSGVSVSSASTFLDICFTPLGAAYQRTGSTDPLDPLAAVHTFDVSRSGGGIKRTIVVLPNGAARIAL